MSSLLVSCGLPGGMMGSMMADLKGVHSSINLTLKNQKKPALSIDDLVVQLFDEVAYVWPKLGYPPLVTPFSQYVKNIALMNIMQLVAGKERFTVIDNNSWDMILGKAGKLPGPLAAEIVEMVKKQGKEFFEGNPQDGYPDELDKFRQEMKENNWDAGQDDEELFELAMHDRQYRDYKSGIAKKRFAEEMKKEMENLAGAASAVADPSKSVMMQKLQNLKEIKSPYKGKIYFDLNYYVQDEVVKLGSFIKKGQRICYIQSDTDYLGVISDMDGEVMEILFKQGQAILKGDVILRVKPKEEEEKKAEKLK